MTKKYTPEELATLAQSARKALNTRIPLTLYLDLCRLKDETGTSIQDLVTDILTRSVNARLSQIEKKKNS
ncbi:hypothetical protein [Bacillus subtilis]|jgi:hypothetical protein|uniref:hypothetical protein n=1 Tax=Bacillus subtilis TaxID=1423 RepID=UPI0021D94B10|nr:hypothetical protein [Bacillus subtilis]